MRTALHASWYAVGVLLLLIALLVSGCAHRESPKPVPVPVAVSCVPKSLGPAPSYPDSDEALRSAGSERFLQLLIAGRERRVARLGETEPVIEGCR